MRSRILVAALAALVLHACRSVPLSSGVDRYVVTRTPLSLSLPSRPLCVAVDPSDHHGVWWWEPGSNGCRSRSTTSVIPGDRGSVSQYMGSHTVDVGFQVPLHGSPTNPEVAGFVDVALVIENGWMKSRDGSARVPVEARADLSLPLMPPHG